MKTTPQDVSEPFEYAASPEGKKNDQRVNPKIPSKQKLNPIQQDRVASKIPLTQTTLNEVEESEQFWVNPKMPCIKTTYTYLN